MRCVAFDLEGCVVDVEPAHHNGWLAAAQEKLGINLVIAEAMMRVPHFIGGPDEDIIMEFYALVNKFPTKQEIDDFLACKWVHYNHLIKKLDIRPRDGWLEVLGEFRRHGIPTTIGTAADLERALDLLKVSGIAKLFTLDQIVLPTDVKRQKPAPDCFRETARRMGFDPGQQIVFEDSPRGVMSGFAARSMVVGMPVYDDPGAIKALREAGAERVYTLWRGVNVEYLIGMNYCLE